METQSETGAENEEFCGEASIRVKPVFLNAMTYAYWIGPMDFKIQFRKVQFSFIIFFFCPG